MAQDFTSQTLAEHAGFIQSLARRLVRDPQVADDLVQDTYLAALEPHVGPVANPPGWFRRVTVRLAGRQRRAEDRRAMREEVVAQKESLPSASDLVASQETLQRVTDAVLALEEPYRSTVLLSFYEGLDARRIAERSGDPLATVRSRRQRALAQLRERLDGDFGGEREAWCLALVPFLRWSDISNGTRAAALVGTTSTWILTMTWIVKGSVAAAAILLAGLFAMQWGSDLPAERSPSDVSSRPALVHAELPTTSEEPGAGTVRAASLLDGERVPLAHSTSSALASSGSAGRLELQVVWQRDGRPASNEALNLLRWELPSGDRQRSESSDEEGMLRLENLPAGKLIVASARGGRVQVDIQSGELTQARLEIPMGFSARGRVVDADGEGVAGARIWLSQHFNHWEGQPVGQSQADGSFVIHEIQSARYLAAQAEGHSPAPMQFLPDLQAQGEDQADVELVLTLGGLGGRLVLEVLDPAGVGIPRAMVRLGAPFLAPIRRAGTITTQNLPNSTGYTDEHGRMSLGGLAPGSSELVVLASGLALHRGQVLVEPGADTVQVVRMQVGASVVGRVLDDQGRPVAGAQVHVDEKYDPLRSFATAGEYGEFHLRGVAGGNVTMVASLKGRGSVKRTLELVDGEESHWEAVISSGRVVSGRVTDEAGIPIDGWYVRLDLGLHSSWSAQDRTDSEGRFSIANCRAGSVGLSLRSNLKLPFPEVRRFLAWDENELDIVVRAEERCDASLRGRLVDAAGDSVHGHLSLWEPGARSAPGVQTDARGSFLLERLRPGTYEVTVRADDSPNFSLGSITIHPGQNRDLGDIPILSSGRLVLFVEGDLASKQGAFRYFYVRRDAGPEVCGQIVELRSSEEADLPIELLPGKYVLDAWADPGVASFRLGFEIEAGSDLTLDLRAEPGQTCALHVLLSPQQVQAESLRLRVFDDQGVLIIERHVWDLSGEGPQASVQLASGHYRLEALLSNGSLAQREFDVSAGAGGPMEWTVELPLH